MREWRILFLALSVLSQVAEGSRRRLQAANEAVDYYDRLRVDPSLVQQVQGSNESNIFKVVDIQGDEYRLADISSFLPFSDGQQIRATVESEAIASLLAIHHFNNPNQSPILDVNEVEGCNVRLTTEFLDTQFSPINSTRKFTEILLRNPTLANPLPTSVVGAYRSATTSPLAILTGVNNIPQVSYVSTSTDFEVKEQYPLFGRTISSTLGEAQVAVEYFKGLETEHVGILFVTDAYGSALQKAFQDAAAEANITTASVAFSYSAGANGDEIPNAVKSLVSIKYRYIYAICFDSHYDPIMTAAYNEGLTGADYLWVFPGLDKGNFQSYAKYPPGSALAKVTQGIAILSPTGGFLPEISTPDEDDYPLENPPTNGFQKLRTAFREALADPEFDAYLRSKLPASLENVSGFDPDAVFGVEPSIYSPLVYDAVSALGLSMCRAGQEVDFFTGEQIFDYFRNSSFDGMSGRVDITPETGTRNYTTLTFVLWNVQNYVLRDHQGNVQFQFAPTSYYLDGQWNEVENMTFLYGDNSTEAPDSLPPVNMDYNYIGTAGRIVGYVLMGIVMVFAIAAFVWLCWFHANKVVISAQPLFLLMVCVGAFVMASAIIPLSLEEPVSIAGLDIACMASPWLYVVGSVIAFSPLFAKTRGIHMAYKNPQLDFIHVASWDIFVTLGVILGLNLAVLIPWTIIDPLMWVRTLREATDIFDRQVESYGSCTNDDALPYVIMLLVLNVGLLLLANWWAYQSRNIETEYHESRYIGISMASVLQAWCMGIPILIVVWDNPSAKFFVEAGIVFVTALAVLLLIYTPKVLAIRSERIAKTQEEKRGAYNKFQKRARSSRGFDDEDSEELKAAESSQVVAAATAVHAAESSKFAEKDSSSTAGATNSSEFTKSPPHEDAGGGASGAAVGVAATGVAAVGIAAVASDGSENNSPSSSRRQSMRPSLSARFLQSAIKSNETTEGMGGIKILHNPRSERSLRMSGGQEVSHEQLISLEERDHAVSDDEDGSMGVVEEEEEEPATEGGVEEARGQQEEADVEAGGGDMKQNATNDGEDKNEDDDTKPEQKESQ